MPQTISRGNDHLERLAQLAKANVSGSMGRKLIIKAQHDLIDSMQKKGLITADDALDLKM